MKLIGTLQNHLPLYASILCQHQLFVGFDTALLLHFMQACALYGLDEQEVLLNPNAATAHMYVLIQGALQIHLETQDGEAVALIGPGESVGELSMIDNARPSARVIAAQTGVVLEISQTQFWHLVDQSTLFRRNLLRLLTKRLRGNNHTLKHRIDLSQEYKVTAYTDALTGLNNRRFLNEILPKQIKTHDTQTGKNLALVMIDIDFFKKFNDQHGHQAGDAVLKQVAQCLQSGTRPDDFVARFGGEEFCLILPHTTEQDAIFICERMRSLVEQTTFLNHTGDKLPKVTISLGLALQTPTLNNPQTLLESADKALYQAKKNGRNQVCLSTSQ